MIKPKPLKPGDKIAIISLSRGILGEKFAEHERMIAEERLKKYGLVPVYLPHALEGIEELEKHPENRAEDLKTAFIDDEIKMIITAIGGNDTYRTLPYLMEDAEFIELVKSKPKIFCGYSDTTTNHVMFHKLGMETFYGPAVITDLAELDIDMLPYTKKYFEQLMNPVSELEIVSSPVWYEERTEFGPDQVGIPRITHDEQHGYEVLNGAGKITGKLFGGCIEVLDDLMFGTHHQDAKEIAAKYNILPNIEDYREMILFLETSDEKMRPDDLEKALMRLKDAGILDAVRGIIVGKPMDEKYYNEYKEIWKKVAADTPVLYNVNFGHAFPRCILPYGAEVEVDFDQGKIRIIEPILDKTE